jgi:hypothetical protein
LWGPDEAHGVCITCRAAELDELAEDAARYRWEYIDQDGRSRDDFDTFGYT